MNGRELSTYTDGTTSIQYKYNLDGIRTSKVVNDIETKYYLEGSSIIFEDRDGDVIYYIYNGSELLGFVYKDKTYYYHNNMFGDIIGILDSNYNEIVTYEYDSWGALVNITDNSNINLGTINPFRYRSYYYDEETEMYYLNSRYYNPKVGRFINGDGYVATGQGFTGNNMFQYCGNNPITRKDDGGDLFGLFDEVIKWSVNAAVASKRRKRQKSMAVGAAPDYKSYFASPFMSAEKAANKYPNCYTYAIGEDKTYNPGEIAGLGFVKPMAGDIDTVEKFMFKDMESTNRTIRRIDGPEGEIASNEYRIAMRVTEEPFLDYLDYHFMVQTSSGYWAEKRGANGGTKLWDNGKNPDEINWNKGLYRYNSEIRYYAISN